MATKETEANCAGSPNVFDCDSLPIPPGTKSRARLPRGLEPEPTPQRIWWLLGLASVGALLVGAAIGRFLLS
jgi:hypothetical protein